MKKTGLKEEGMTTPNVRKTDGKTAIIKEILSWIRTIAIGVVIGILLVVFVIQRDNVYGDSMFPTLENGYVVFTEKISTYFDNFDRGDIVILDGHDMEGYNHEEYLIKRVVGLPGETIRITEGKVYIKPADSDEFYELKENYLQDGVETVVMSTGIEKGYNEITLGPDEYYCMGDNRPVSNDSRTLGPFSADRIKGIAIIVVYPFTAFGLL
ncbi:MAG: signal peptidase I [Clostridiales bacterium]|nr:signal peptidase I [Clostridiales bacterium]